MMIVAIKIGSQYFQEFISETKGYGGHTKFGRCVEIQNVVLSNKVIELDPISAGGILKEVIYLMRMGDIPKQDIKVEIIS